MNLHLVMISKMIVIRLFIFQRLRHHWLIMMSSLRRIYHRGRNKQNRLRIMEIVIK